MSDEASGPDLNAQAQPVRLSVALFLLSTATVLFTLAIFRLLSFFIMPSLFFDLLFVGFPIGAFIGVRFFRSNQSSFRKSLWILQATMVASVAAALACKHFDYLRAHLFEVNLSELIWQMSTFTGFFVPFFCAYGLSEYIGYQVGHRELKGRMAIVYSIYLFGAAGAYLFMEAALSSIGVSRLLVLSIALVAVAALLVSKAGWSRRCLLVELTIAIAVLALPSGLEQTFLRGYKGEGAQSTEQYSKNGFNNAFQEWGRYSLTEVMHSPQENLFAGFYNDLMQWEYSPKYGFVERGLGMLPINRTPKDGTIAIIGSGGGRQVKWASQPQFAFRRILALEVEPAVMRAVREELLDEFGSVYERENVDAVLHEARGYLETHDDKFDLIYLPSVGGYPQMMLEPGNMIRTLGAYKTIRSRLTDNGVLAIWYPRGLDPQNILTRQYVQTFRSEELGLQAEAYSNSLDFLILATPSSDRSLIELGDEDRAFLAAPATENLTLPPDPDPFEKLFVGDDPSYQPITDAQPFLAGNVRHILSLESVYTLFGIVAGTLGLIGISALVLLRKRGDPGIPGRSYLQVAGLSFLIGANFLVFERCLILALFKKMFFFHDAVVLGAISFLIISGIGSSLIRDRWRPPCQIAGVVFALILTIFHDSLSDVQILMLVAPVALVTGSFFPAIFERAAANPLTVFAMDAVGAALGSITAFFIPIVFGIDYFFPVAAITFVATAVATYLFFRPSKASPPGDA